MAASALPDIPATMKTIAIGNRLIEVMNATSRKGTEWTSFRRNLFDNEKAPIPMTSETIEAGSGTVFKSEIEKIVVVLPAPEGP
jgi:hypothetical protein